MGGQEVRVTNSHIKVCKYKDLEMQDLSLAFV